MEEILRRDVMRIALIAVAFPPLRSSGAVQMRDLALEFSAQGHDVTVLVPDSDLDSGWQVDYWQGIRVARFRAQKIRDVGYVRRTFGEFFLPYIMLRNLRKSPLSEEIFDGVAWYSPSIFLGPVVAYIKKKSHCPSYLILRDIFPEWAVDLGLMRKGLIYRFFSSVANYQYSLADVIGVQSSGNLSYFEDRREGGERRVEVLNNWLANTVKIPCSIQIKNTSLAGRKIFVYAGNMGVAQALDVFIQLAQRLESRTDIGFVFVGRGSHVPKLREKVASLRLSNTLFFDEIEPDEIPGLYEQCDIGLVALDPRHKSHNIPGKFLSYLQVGLPVLASVNHGNDIISLINTYSIGYACSNWNVDSLVEGAHALLDELDKDDELGNRCRSVFEELYSPEVAVKQIVSAMGFE